MPNDVKTKFQEHLDAANFLPKEASACLSDPGVAVSMRVGEKTPDYFVVAFVSENDQRIGPIALNPVVAKALYGELGTYLGALEVLGERA